MKTKKKKTANILMAGLKIMPKIKLKKFKSQADLTCVAFIKVGIHSVVCLTPTCLCTLLTTSGHLGTT